MAEQNSKIKKSIGRRIVRIVLKTILFLLLLFIGIVLLIQTAPVQNYIRGKAVTWLEKKLKTRVAVGKIYIGFPKDVVVENIYLEDQAKDTLFSGGKIKLDISLIKLIKGNVEINDLLLENITAKVKRELPDTTFNFQFILDAFASKEKKETATPTDTSNSFSLKGLTLNNIRLRYKDTITGNDAAALIGHFETRINTFDLYHKTFDIARFNIDGLTAKIYQSKPLVEAEPASKDLADAKEPVSLQLNVKEVSLEKINIDYGNNISRFYTLLDLQKLVVHPDKIDLAHRVIDINDFILAGTTAAIRLGKSEQAKIVEKETEQEVKSQADAGWKISAASLKLDNNNLKFDNDNKPIVKKGMDYAHMDARGVTFTLEKFFYGGDSISGNLSHASLKEKSGLDIQKLQTDFAYGTHGASLKDLYIKTPGTELQHAAAIHYASPETIKKDFKNADLDIDLQKSKVQIKDILLFVPALSAQPAMANPTATIYISSRIHGRIADLKINELKLSGMSNTKVDISGTLKGLPDIKTLNADITIRSLQSSKQDILVFVPASSLPKNGTIPDRFNITGNIKGNQQNFATKLLVQTNLGDARVQAVGKNITDKVHAVYDATLETNQLDLGTLLQKKELLGPVSATLVIKGTGIDKTTANATLNGMIHSAVVKQYTYHQLAMNGAIANQRVKIKAGITDPNITIQLDAAADLSAKYPSVELHTMIDSIKTEPLHWTTEPLIYHGQIDADFASTNPDSPDGKLYVTHSLLIKNNQRITMDTILVAAGRTDSGQYIHLNSDIANAVIQGRYKITQFGSIFQQSIEPYFSLAQNDSGKTKEPFDFTFNAQIINKPILKSFLPGLTRMDSITLTSHFSDNNGWYADLTAPAIDLNENKIHKLELHAGTGTGALIVNGTIDQFTSGGNIALFNTKVNASVKDNKVAFAINIHDKADKNKYNLKGLFEQPAKGTYAFSLDGDSLLLNYDKWTVTPGNKIEIGKENILATDFTLSKDGQQFRINSVSQAAGSPLEVNFSNFKLETLTAFIQPDSTLIGGVLNGKAVISDLPKAPVFTSDLTINDLNVKKDTAGNLKLLVNNKTANTYNAAITLSGKGNNVQITGNYYAKQADNNLDLLLNLETLPLTTAQAFSAGAIREASGSVNGKFTVKGNLKQPKVNGDLNFVQAAFIPAKLNSRFVIDKEKLQVNEEGITFNQFSIKDSAGNQLTLNGKAATTNFTNYNFDFTVRANNFQALNSTKKDNKIFYGQLYFNTNLDVKGTEKAPAIDGRITVNDKTKMTIVLPQKDPGVVDREGVVFFVDKDAPGSDSLFLKSYDSLNISSITGMDVSANIEIKKEAELTLIVDQGSGDFLNVHGEALLTASVDPSGKITLAGSYELEDGAYQLTFNLLRRKFNIQKGSKLVWGGEPTQADVNITAAYEVSTAPLDLVKNQLVDASTTNRNTYLQKLPFQVFLKMTGKLLQPEITFDIVLPENRSYNASPEIVTAVRTKLEMLRQETGELNKQVFALLLLSRFVGENPFNSSSSTSAETLVRQSASKLLTEQLNRLAEDLVQGVDLNFDVQSSDDYSTGNRQDRTDLNVGLSKKLLNDRLTVTVGSNFELEGAQNSNQNSSNIAGNVALNYRLSKDGRYVMRAYRKNEYQGVLDGYVVETGVGFIITIDYNKFKEIFRKKKPRTKRGQNEAPKNTDAAAAQKTEPINANP